MPFPVRQALDDEGQPIVREGDEIKFLVAVCGDNFMIPFQCEWCQFVNITRRLPPPSCQKDSNLLCMLRRANLDAFRSREPSTVKANLRELRRTYITHQKCGLLELLPPMGPHPLCDAHGLAAAVVMLDRSLDPGGCEATVQWQTARKSRAALTNFWQASVVGLSDSVGAYETHNLWISDAATRTFFMARFAEGMRGRMGEAVKPDEPMTVPILMETLRALEMRRIIAMDQKPPGWEDSVFRIDRIAAWHCVGFCGSLRGEEMLLIEAAGTQASAECLTSPPPGLVSHFLAVFDGPVKNCRSSGNKFSLPIAATTEGSGIPAGKWFRRCSQALKRRGVTSGPFFVSHQDSPSLSDFEDDFFDSIEAARAARPSLFPVDLDTREAFGPSRSLRRGSVAKATNAGVSPHVIDAVNRWRMEKKPGGASFGAMRSRHARLDLLAETLLRCSRAP